MRRVGRNDPCPCGSGRKFKKCHSGREEEIPAQAADPSPGEMGARIAALPGVDYGRSREMADALDLKGLTGRETGIRFVDLNSYAALGFLGSGRHEGAQGRAGGVFINPYKTQQADPKNLYIAISPDIDASTVVHELAHVLTHLTGSGHAPGTLHALGFEFDIPVDHLEHTDEFGYWLDDLRRRFEVVLDADDAVVLYLYQNGRLIRSAELDQRNGVVLKAKSEGIFTFLSRKSVEIDGIIRGLPGYMGPRESG